MPEIVYVLTNDAMKDMVKIGRTTTSVEQRMKELDNTSLPLPFQCYFAGEVVDSAHVESHLHKAFADKRVRNNREFFKVAPEQVRAALLIASPREVTPRVDVVVDQSDVQAIKNAAASEERRSRLKFSDLDIPVGSILFFSKDEKYTCKVIGDGKVLFEDQTMSPSAAALAVVRELGYQWSAVSGSDYWVYEDETLTARRIRLEDR